MYQLDITMSNVLHNELGYRGGVHSIKRQRTAVETEYVPTHSVLVHTMLQSIPNTCSYPSQVNFPFAFAQAQHFII